MASKKRIGVGVLGATGYGAGELLRLLAQHPEAEVVSVTSSSQSGSLLAEAHPQLAGIYGHRLESSIDLSRFTDYEHTVVFLCLPQGKSPETIAAFIADSKAAKVKFIDFSGDLRLKNPAHRQRYYPDSSKLDAKLVGEFVYGLPEINREKIRQARFVANPGCLAETSALAVLPITSAGYQGTIVFDGKTGTSGAGRAAQELFHHPERHANVAAYKMLEHRHEPEIHEALGDSEGNQLNTFFVPHVLPSSRGIFVTAYLTLAEPQTTEQLLKLYRTFYQSAPFVRVVEGSPELHSVIGSNFCDVGIVCRGKQVVAMATLDNLGKGMAGQAIENMNLMTGLEQTAGLWVPGLGLV